MTQLRVIATQLDQITIASPCTLPWESMPGDERVRFCGKCRQQVYNVEQLTSSQARRLIEHRERRVCVRLLRRDDGTVVTADCWTRLRAARKRGLVPWVAMLVVVFFVQLWTMRFGLGLLMSLPDRFRSAPAANVPPPLPPRPGRKPAPRVYSLGGI